MFKKIVLSFLVLLVSYSIGIGISYWIKNSRPDRTQRLNSLSQQPSQNAQDVTKLHPYTIQALREKQYIASELVVERDLGDQGAFRSQVVSYKSDGLKLYALMNTPDSPMPEGGFPVIILNHGYIEPTVYDTVNSYKSYMDQYSRQGFLVLKPDYRSHDNSEGEQVSAHIAPDYTVDVLNLLESVKKHPQANPNLIGMWGHSMGGGITLRALVVSKDIKAAALLAGVVASPNAFYSYWQGFRDDPRTPQWIKENAAQTLEEFGSPVANADLWHSISPYSYLSEFTAPVQIHHATADTDVPLVFSDELNKALLDAEKPVEYFVYQGGDHNLAGSARGPVLSRTIDFFKNNLK